jgi:DNA-binding transcriptional MerR regulator
LEVEVDREYSIGELAELAGVSTRTLRHYDRLGLLCPARRANGYRAYGPAEVDRLQQILFLRELGMGLKAMARVIQDEDHDPLSTLRSQLAALERRRARLDEVMEAARRSIAALEGGKKMSDVEKFEAFKRARLRENEERYGSEIRESYGEESVAAANQRFMGLTPEAYAEMEALGERLHAALRQAVAEGDPSAPLACEVARMHKEWLCYFWPSYSPQAHRGVCRMYIEDERFTAYYEDIVSGGAQFLHDAVHNWLEDSEA